MNKVLSSVNTNSSAIVNILSTTLMSIVYLGAGISGVLLFLNLDFQNVNRNRGKTGGRCLG
jgi:hypothetical protein